ncbi:MAG: cupin domain-containing protein [Hyphomicrobiales bacterium]|nr:MAG: cupin domain-containing protein [Hyphomicrobiales bacterium]
MVQATHFAWADRPVEQFSSDIARSFVTSEKAMIGRVTFAKGAVVGSHHHVHEQFTHVVEGCLRFFLGENKEQVVTVRAGEVILIPPNLPHAVEAVEDTVEYDVFTPPREDWIAAGAKA